MERCGHERRRGPLTGGRCAMPPRKGSAVLATRRRMSLCWTAAVARLIWPQGCSTGLCYCPHFRATVVQYVPRVSHPLFLAPCHTAPIPPFPCFPCHNKIYHARLTIGVVGFGNFGQFISRFFARQGHRVIGQSRGNYDEKAAAIGCEYVNKPDLLMDAKPDVVIFCTSIMSLHTVLSKFPVHRLSGVLVADVLSVKMYPHDLLIRMLPSSADIVCTHPMFGPESGRDSWKGLPFVYDVVRVDPLRKKVCNNFISMWKREECKMVAMESFEHDEYAASTQFITHTTGTLARSSIRANGVGRMLSELNVVSTPINTRGFESLLSVVDTTTKDSDDLFYGLYKYNPQARAQLDKLESALRNIRTRLEAAEAAEAAAAKKMEKKYGLMNVNTKYSSISEEVLQNLILRVTAKS
ncbi:unnamed protein product [Chondrus crispus]|uniref:Prephenate/arogenate dehydrogenase domain-containing protein n=1 Tax=Chondrus crispus TaxID=2769 RepID=R7QBM2_CHOCR|nr:unnamed protein product [Chondrus crispus]CDF35183.1 unnamed protein product [Chondrus crispus]|eukprot:XP_005715002.1 unnamed protein product [Chondrus crispus]